MVHVDLDGHADSRLMLAHWPTKENKQQTVTNIYIFQSMEKRLGVVPNGAGGIVSY